MCETYSLYYLAKISNRVYLYRNVHINAFVRPTAVTCFRNF